MKVTSCGSLWLSYIRYQLIGEMRRRRRRNCWRRLWSMMTSERVNPFNSMKIFLSSLFLLRANKIKNALAVPHTLTASSHHHLALVLSDFRWWSKLIAKRCALLSTFHRIVATWTLHEWKNSSSDHAMTLRCLICFGSRRTSRYEAVKAVGSTTVALAIIKIATAPKITFKFRQLRSAFRCSLQRLILHSPVP